LAVLLGKERASLLFYSMVIASYLWLPIASALTDDWMINITFITVPVAIWGIKKLRSEGFLYGVEISSIIYILYSVVLTVSIIL
ncbi:MAG: hypothetical protein ACP5LF_06515, partial [Nitrososphaeria archaeon]